MFVEEIKRHLEAQENYKRVLEQRERRIRRRVGSA